MKVLGVLDLALNLDSASTARSRTSNCASISVTGIEVVLISVFIFFFTRRFVGIPIQQLIEGTKAVSAMELDKPIDIIHTSEELDHLARSFNIMRERLQAAMAEINQFTQQLETKVEQRTEQLQGGAPETAADATGWPRSDSFPPAWRTRSTIRSRAC